MEPERRPVTLISADGPTVPGEFLLWEESPGDADLVRLAVRFGGREIASEADDFFSALCSIRTELEVVGLMPRCYGSSRNVYPSGMSRVMGSGVKAYRLTPGQRARTSDLVNIFDDGQDVDSVSVQIQEEHYRVWVGSLNPGRDA